MKLQVSRSVVQVAVTAAALLLAAFGAAFLFAPRETARALGWQAGSWLAVELLGAALLGFAAMNWIARGSLLGGIYGRSVVVANQLHFTAGALLLVKRGVALGGSPAYWLLAALYVTGALLYNGLLLSGGPRKG